MATYRAIATAAAAVAGLLEESVAESEFDELAFEVVSAGDVAAGAPSGAGVFVHRVAVDPSQVQRSDPADVDPSRRGPQPVAVDVHLLVVVSAAGAGTRLALIGWIMRTLEQHPILPADLLNRYAVRSPVFAGDETARLAFEHLSHAELLRLRDGLGAPGYDVMPLPYVVSGLQLDVGPDGDAPRRRPPGR